MAKTEDGILYQGKTDLLRIISHYREGISIQMGILPAVLPLLEEKDLAKIADFLRNTDEQISNYVPLNNFHAPQTTPGENMPKLKTRHGIVYQDKEDLLRIAKTLCEGISAELQELPSILSKFEQEEIAQVVDFLQGLDVQLFTEVDVIFYKRETGLDGRKRGEDTVTLSAMLRQARAVLDKAESELDRMEAASGVPVQPSIIMEIRSTMESIRDGEEELKKKKVRRTTSPG